MNKIDTYNVAEWIVERDRLEKENVRLRRLLRKVRDGQEG